MPLIIESAVILMFTCAVFGQTKKEECLSNRDCPNDQLCADFQCINPCLLNFCGNPLACKVSNHIPVCACLDDYSGPLSGGPSKKSGKKKYQLQLERLNWHGALLQCLSKGMAFASIESQEDQDMVVNLIKQTDIGNCGNKTHCGRWWMGASDLHEKGEYTWYSNSRLITYRHFRNGEPSGHRHGCENEHCVELIFGSKHGRNWDYEWNDTACSLSQYFICEYFE